MNEFLEPFERLLTQHYPPERLRVIEGDEAAASAVLGAIDAAGFLDALRTEAEGGAGLSLLEAEPLLRAIGVAAAPADIALAMLRRRIERTPSRALLAVVHSALIAGALEKLLAFCSAHVCTREQFGKPLAAQQAIQQQMAQLAEQAALVRVASQYGCAGGFDVGEPRAAVAKHAASAAVPIATSIAHAVHGAIGVTEEYDMQLWIRRLYDWRMAAGSESYWANKLGRSRLDQAEKNAVEFVREI